MDIRDIVQLLNVYFEKQIHVLLPSFYFVPRNGYLTESIFATCMVQGMQLQGCISITDANIFSRH